MMRFVTNERNKERKAVRARAVAMGDMIMKHQKAHPNQDLADWVLSSFTKGI